MLHLVSELVPPKAPHLSMFHLVSEADIDKKAELDANLRELERWSSSFSHSIVLYGHCCEATDHAISNRVNQPNLVWPKWGTIAARSAVLAARNFGQSLQATSSVAKYFEKFRTKEQLQVYAECRRSFDEIFPNVDKVRHSIAHPEYYPKTITNTETGKNFSSNGLIIEGCSRVQLQDVMIEGAFHCTFDGEYLSCPINTDAAILLVEITKTLFNSMSLNL
jgi:hypothetical protein